MQEVYEAILNKPVTLGTIQVTEKRRFWFPRIREVQLVVNGATADTMYRIVSIIETLDTEGTGGTQEARMYNMITGNTDAMIKIIALGIHNQASDPPQWLLDALRTLEWEVLASYMKQVYRRLGIEPFFDCMVSIKNLNVHRSDTPETTAPGELSEI